MTTTSPTLCAIRGCAIPGAHLAGAMEQPDHTPETCRGCVPGLAEPGLLICRRHHDQALFNLARIVTHDQALAVALAPYRSPQAPKGEGGRSSEPPAQIDGRISELRSTIYFRLAHFCDFIAVEGHFSAPRRRDIDGMAEYMADHADWLSSNRITATTWGDAVREVASRGHRAAYQTRASGTYLGPCPVPVAHQGVAEPCSAPIRFRPPEDVEDDADPLLYEVTCPKCRTTETVAWWREKIVGSIEAEQLAADPMAMVLSQTLGRPVTGSTVRGWAFTGKLPAAAHTERGRPLYDRAAALRVARKAYGLEQPDTPQSRSA